MSRPSISESHAMDAAMSRAASRAGSISTLWSSADVPFCLDPRVNSTSDRSHLFPSRNNSIAGSIYRNSARYSQVSMDIGRPSIDIPDEYPRRPDIIRLSPPRAAGSGSSSGSSSSRVPSFSIGTIDEDQPMRSSPISKFPYHPPSPVAEQRFLSSRFSEDTVDEPYPHIPHSGSTGTFGTRLSLPRKSMANSEGSHDDSSRSSSLQGTHPSGQAGRLQAGAQTPAELYNRAYRFFDKQYTVQPSLDKSAAISSLSVDASSLGEEHRLVRPSLGGSGSDVSHEGSVPSCSRSHTSTQASTSDSASSCSADFSLSRVNNGASAIVPVGAHMQDVFTSPNPVATSIKRDVTLTLRAQPSFSSDKSNSLTVPSLPSIPSFNSSHTARPDQSRDLRRRPSTADVYSQAQQPSPLSASHPVFPHPLPLISPTEPARYEIRSYAMAPAPASAVKPATTSHGSTDSRWTASRLLRARVASTPKLRLNESSLFPSEQAWKAQPPVPALPGKLGNEATDRRPSTAQLDGRLPFFGRRFRSRTLGESDQAEANLMQIAVNGSRADSSAVTSQRPVFASSVSPSSASSMAAHRHPSQVSASSSLLHTPTYGMPPTPGSSVGSAPSPATTNSSLPITPRTTSTFPRPKSRGTGTAAKNGGAGWASYLHSGLTLHLEHEHGRATQLNLTYLAYDPFGRPEQLVEGTEAARALTPKRPKSRGDKNQEAEESGTLEFGPSDEMRVGACSFDVSRKSEGSVLLKHLTVGEDTRADLLTRQATLSLKTLGDHQVSGYERKGRLAWKFSYRVETDPMHVDRRRLVPLRFSCSATLLNPERARKSRLLNLVKKQMVPTLSSKAVGASSVDSPRSASSRYDDPLVGSTDASPASFRRSNRQFVGEAQQPVTPESPSRRINAGVLSNHNSPLRQASRAELAMKSISSGNSSFYSQPATPGRDGSNAVTSMAKLHLQASPVSAQFGQPSHGSRALRPIGNIGAAIAPALQLDLGQVSPVALHGDRKLREKPSMHSLSASSTSSGSVQHPKPMIINGRKLIPISLPAGLARRNRIDPALLQANVVSPQAQPPLRNVTSFSDFDRQRSISMHSAASSSDIGQLRMVQKQADEIKCLLSNQPRTISGTSSSSRPPTASESIKLEYLARAAGESQQAADLSPSHQLRQQKSFTGAVLAPSAFADSSRARRQRSKTIEGEAAQRRPFTADAWGQSQYPSREQISSVRAFSQQHQAQIVDRGTSFGSSESSQGGIQHSVPREVLSSSFAKTSFASDRTGGTPEGDFKPLPAPPRPQTRPRTAQTATQADSSAIDSSSGARLAGMQHGGRYHIPARTVHAVRS